MWVTQTYLGKVEPDAKLFVYYLYEDYNDQRGFTELVQHHLEDLGEVYGERVSLMMPNPRFSGQIEAEVREFRKLWEAVRGMLPGLLLSPCPLVELTESMRGCKFIPFNNEQNAEIVARNIQLVRGLANEATSKHEIQPPDAARPSFFSRLFEAVEVKPGIWGLKLDIKKLVR